MDGDSSLSITRIRENNFQFVHPLKNDIQVTKSLVIASNLSVVFTQVMMTCNGIL